MNLTIDPWIPAVRPDGTRGLFSLQDLFAQAHELRDLAVKPHERIALMRLLLCTTQAALNGPADQDAWEQCEPLIQPLVRDYLDKWQAAFELFGDGPRFLQVKTGVLAAAVPVMEQEGIARLNLSMASGESNATLFDNSASDQHAFTPAESALSLLTYQCYSPLLGRGYKGRSPCADESMLHTFRVGPNLLATLRLNLLTRETCRDSYGHHGMGRPLWEVWSSNKPSLEVTQLLTSSYLGRLVPLARAVWLDGPKSMTLGNALVYDGFEDSGYREASATIVAAGSKLALLSAKSDRAFWRELPAVCVTRRQGDGVSGPLAFRNPSPAAEISIWAGALLFPKKNAKIEDSIESTYRLPAGMFTDFGRLAYEKGVAFAEAVDDPGKGPLIRAVKEYSDTLWISKPAYDRARQHFWTSVEQRSLCRRARIRRARQHFWTSVEQHLSALIDLARNMELAADLPNCAWGKAVQRAAREAYESACPRQTPRQIQAFALGLRKFTFTPKSAKPSTK